MKKQVWFVLLFCIGLAFFEACIGTSCDCPNTLPFFNFEKLKVETIHQNTFGEPLRLALTADSVIFLAKCQSKWPNFTPSAFGCSCLENGDRGPKIPILGFNIIADQDFNDSLPAGVSLNSLFFATDSYYSITEKLEPTRLFPLDDLTNLTPFSYGQEQSLLLILGQIPEKSFPKGVKFTIDCFKTDSSRASVTTSAIQF